MADLDCQAAFSQEMAALNEISKTSKSDTLEAKIDETNRLLKLLCIGILGKDKE